MDDARRPAEAGDPQMNDERSRRDPSRALHRPRHHGERKQVLDRRGRFDPIDRKTDPDREPRPESDAAGVEALIDAAARVYRRGDAAPADSRGRPLPRDGAGRFAPGDSTTTNERDVRAYLTAEAFGYSLAELCVRFGIASRGTASRRVRAGKDLVEKARAKNEGVW